MMGFYFSVHFYTFFPLISEVIQALSIKFQAPSDM